MTDKVKTDNSYLADKVGLRAEHLPAGHTITVLDCFAGSGRIWRAVKRRHPKKDIRILAMDKKNIGFHLPGDNLAWLKSMDLSKFNVIDLDAYGVPYEQLKIILDRGYKGIVFVTFIQSVFVKMPSGLLHDVGFTDAMIDKAPALLNARGFDRFAEWLAGYGVKSMFHRSHARKHYICFSL